MGQRNLILTILVVLVILITFVVEAPASTTPAGGLWITHGPRGGRALVLEVSPAFSQDGVAFSGEWLTSYQSTESGMGIMRSLDAGKTWHLADAGTQGVYYASAVHDFAFSPDFEADGTVFAATWGGLFKSLDGGENWTWLEGAYEGPPGAYTTIAVAPDFAQSEQVLAGDWGGLLRSDDGGDMWERVDGVGAAADIAYAPAAGSESAVFASDGARVSRSQDGAHTWTTVLTAPVKSLAVSPAFSQDHTVFGGGGAHLYQSVDGGTTWISRTIDASVTMIHDLAISPQFATDSTLFAGASNGLFWSEDGGASWSAIAAYEGMAIRALAISGQWPQHTVLLVGTDAGVYRLLTADPTGGDVKEPAAGFAPLVSSPLAWSASAGLLLTGTGNHGVYASNDSGASWQTAGLQASFSYYSFSDVEISPDFDADDTLFAAWLSGTGIGGAVYRTTDGGATWQNVYGTDYVGDLAISPAFAIDHTLFATSGERGLMRSTNGGDDWEEVGTWPEQAHGLALYVALPSNYPADGTLFAGGSRGFWRLPGGTTTWQAADSGLTSQHTVVSLAVSPDYAHDQTLLALAYWPTPTAGGQQFGVFRSEDGGANWVEGSTGIAAASLFDITFSPGYAQDQTAYLTTLDGGLYRSQDGGQTWQLLGGAPGMPALYDVVIREDNRVFVGSQSGVWQYIEEPYRTHLPLFYGRIFAP